MRGQRWRSGMGQTTVGSWGVGRKRESTMGGNWDKLDVGFDSREEEDKGNVIFLWKDGGLAGPEKDVARVAPRRRLTFHVESAV